MSILYDGNINLFKISLFIKFLLEWSAALTVSSICLSVVSMLASSKKKIKLKFSEFGGTSYLSFLIEFFRVMPEMLYMPF